MTRVTSSAKLKSLFRPDCKSGRSTKGISGQENRGRKMSEEKLYAVKNDKGEWLSFDSSHESVWYTNNPTLFKDRIYAEALAGPYGHVVELVEAPAKVVVSEDEAEMLERAKVAAFPAHIFDSGAAGSLPGSQDRLMCAYVVGWTVEKPKRYVLPMEGTKLADGTIAYATLDHTGVWTIKAYSKKQSAVAFHNTVAQADIDAAPDWVKAIKAVEMTDDEQ